MDRPDYSRPQINLTKNLPHPNYYTLALDGEFKDYAFNEERAPMNKGKWRSEIFKIPEEALVDLEIGTGNGTHFQNQCAKHPERNLVGIEIKYKPLIQTIRGALRKGSTNGRVCRYHAFNVDLLFEKNEVNNVFIFFPDPWTSPRKPRNRIVKRENLDLLYEMQRPGSFLRFKTDSREYFDWSLEEIKHSKYKVIEQTFDLHNSPYAEGNFITQFERIFLRKGIPINMILLQKD